MTNAASPEREPPMDLQLTNKKALVTGSTAGIGFAIASLLAQEGASVVVNGRSPRRGDEAVQRIRTSPVAARAPDRGAQATGIAADLPLEGGEDPPHPGPPSGVDP